jgi:hypothetical protein
MPSRRPWRIAAIVVGVFVSMSTPLVAQDASEGEKPEEGLLGVPPELPHRPGDVQRVFVLEFASAAQMQSLLEVFPARVHVYQTRQTEAIAVSGAPAVVAAIEQTVKRLDVPPPPEPTVEISVWVMLVGDSVALGTDTPPELEDVVRQLSGTLGLGACRLVDTLFARTHPAEGVRVISTAKLHPSVARPATLSLSIKDVSISGTSQPTVQLSNVALGVNYALGQPGEAAFPLMVAIEGDVDIRSGQYAVVGRTGVGDLGGSVILVLRAEIVDPAKTE